MPEVELIVVDDGSSDDTPGLAAALGARVIRSPYSMGTSAQRSGVAPVQRRGT